MEPLLAEAYAALLQVERLTGTLLSNRQSLMADASAGNAEIQRDLDEFNRLARELGQNLSSLTLPELKERLIFLRIQAMNVENEFSRLADAIQQVFMDTARRDG